MATMNIDLSEALELRVRELAKASGKGLNAIVTDAIERLLEDEADAAEVAARLKRFEETGEAFDHETALDKLRLRAAD